MNGPYGTFFVIFSNSVLGFQHNTKNYLDKQQQRIKIVPEFIHNIYATKPYTIGPDLRH